MKLAAMLLSSLSALYLLGGTAQAQPPTHAVEYCLTHIWTRDNPTPDALDLYFTSMNDKGEIVGYLRDLERVTPTRAVLWRKGQLIDLSAQIGHKETRASGINDHGDIVGSYSDDGREFHAFMLRHGKVVEIQGVPGVGNPHAFDINDKREVIVSRAGHPEQVDNVITSYLWKRGSATQLEPLEPTDSTFPHRVNNRGITAGMSLAVDSSAFWPVLWQDGTVMPLGTPEGAESADAVDINNRGQVAVNVATHIEERGVRLPFIWHEGEFTELPLMAGADYGAYITGINDQRVTIGSTSRLVGGEALPDIPTVWRDGQATDLNALICSGDPLQPYVSLRFPMLINNRGEILVTGYDSRAPWGSYFLLTPKR